MGPMHLKLDLVSVVGPVSKTKRKKVLCNQISWNQADTKEVCRNFFQVKKEMKENGVPDILQQIYYEFTECQH